MSSSAKHLPNISCKFACCDDAYRKEQPKDKQHSLAMTAPLDPVHEPNKHDRRRETALAVHTSADFLKMTLILLSLCFLVSSLNSCCTCYIHFHKSVKSLMGLSPSSPYPSSQKQFKIWIVFLMTVDDKLQMYGSVESAKIPLA